MQKDHNQINKLISVIIPVYNVRDYLEKCIYSVITQSYSYLEILLIDDGSNDGSGLICDDFEEKDKRIKSFHKINGGLSDARNFGIEKASGEYLCFIDSDDYIPENYIESLLLAITIENADISFCEWIKVYPHRSENQYKSFSKKTYLSNVNILKGLFTGEINPSACGKLYKSILFSNIRFPIGVLLEDFATTYQLFGMSSKISQALDTVYFYTQRNSSISYGDFEILFLNAIRISDEIDRFVKQKFPALKNEGECYSARILLRTITTSCKIADIRDVTKRKKIFDELQKYKNSIHILDLKDYHYLKFRFLFFYYLPEIYLSTYMLINFRNFHLFL